MASQTDLRDADELDDDLVPRGASLGARVLWGAVFVLGGALLLAVLALASVAVITPEALREPCQRTELVTPAGCSAAGTGGFAGGR